MRIINFLFLIFLCGSLNAADVFFIPPKDWLLVDPKILSSHVKICFMGNAKEDFRPSMNLAIEEVNVSLNEYVAAVKKIYGSNRDNRFRDLGKIQTNAGEARMTSVDLQTQWGAARLMQLIFVKESKVYILTAGASKEDFSNYAKEFDKAFRSLTYTTDLVSCIPEQSRRETLEKKRITLNSEDFQKYILEEFKDMGAYWQILVLDR